MGLFSSLGKAVGGLVKTSVKLTTSMIKAPFQFAGGVVDSIFGDNQSSQQQIGYGPSSPSIFGGGQMMPPPPPFMHGPHHMHGHHGHHGHHGGGIHLHFDS